MAVSSDLQKLRFGSFTHSRRAWKRTAEQKKKMVMLVKAGAVLPVAAAAMLKIERVDDTMRDKVPGWTRADRR